MTTDRIADTIVLLDSTEEIIERLSPEEALSLASDLTEDASAVLKATAKLENAE